jgi:D-glycero-alpha-D-manno-heptose-7-phosphate kinase
LERHYNARVRLASSAPTRIDLAGGTIDIWPLYLLHRGAETLNAAISLRAHCAIASRGDGRVHLVSEDTGDRVEAASVADLDLDRLPLIARLVARFGASGIDVTTRSDSPVGAGLGGSSTLAVATAAALAAWTKRDEPAETLLAAVMNVEGQVLGVPPGVQDYRPAMYGGVLAIGLGIDGTPAVRLPVDPDALTARLVVAFTGASRNSGINNWDVFKRRIDGDPAVTRAFDDIVRATNAMRSALDRGDWPAVGRHLDEEWQARKRLAPGVTTPAIDALLASARRAGAWSGKVCGAGGGGCLFVLTDPAHKAAVSSALAEGGARVLPVSVERTGLELKWS